MSEHRPRIYLHPDRRYISIGFDDTQDTLLKMPDEVAARGDWERAAEWVLAMERLLKSGPRDRLVS